MYFRDWFEEIVRYGKSFNTTSVSKLEIAGGLAMDSQILLTARKRSAAPSIHVPPAYCNKPSYKHLE